MNDAIVLEEQKGLWIEERLLRQAQLGRHLQVMVGQGEIRILPAGIVLPRLPYGVSVDEARTVLREVREEAIALYGDQPPRPTNHIAGGGRGENTRRSRMRSDRRSGTNSMPSST